VWLSSCFFVLYTNVTTQFVITEALVLLPSQKFAHHVDTFSIIAVDSFFSK
jgi:hypothetical protein